VPLQLYNGFFYREAIGTPTVAILAHLEKRVSQVLSYGRPNKVVFHIPSKSPRYRRELIAAERLLARTSGDFDLVIATLDLLFDDRRFQWKSYDSLIYIDKDFTTALAIAKANQEITKEREKRTAEAIAATLNREDVFE